MSTPAPPGGKRIVPPLFFQRPNFPGRHGSPLPPPLRQSEAAANFVLLIKARRKSVERKREKRQAREEGGRTGKRNFFVLVHRCVEKPETGGIRQEIGNKWTLTRPSLHLAKCTRFHRKVQFFIGETVSRELHRYIAGLKRSRRKGRRGSVADVSGWNGS